MAIFSPRINWKEWIIVLFVIVLLAAIAIPNFVKARVTGCLPSIAGNLRRIEDAKDQWAKANKKASADKVWMSDLTAYFQNNVVPVSITNEVYDVSTVGALATASFQGTLEGKRGPFTVTSF